MKIWDVTRFSYDLKISTSCYLYLRRATRPYYDTVFCSHVCTQIKVASLLVQN